MEPAAARDPRCGVKMEIRPLADHPDAIPKLSEWFHAEWHCFDGRSRGEIEAQLRDSLNRNSLPITFIALSGAELIGTVSLDGSDLPTRDHLSPWLASLYVTPSRRRAGVGRALVQHVVAFARQRAISPIYLWTPSSTRLYEACGWQILCRETFAGQPITLMRLAMGRQCCVTG